MMFTIMLMTGESTDFTPHGYIQDNTQLTATNGSWQHQEAYAWTAVHSSGRSGQQWTAVDSSVSAVRSSGQQWTAVVSSGQQWSAVVSSGQQWTAVHSSGQQSTAVDSHEQQWSGDGNGQQWSAVNSM